MTNTIEADTRREWLEAHLPVTVLDVRGDEDRPQWHGVAARPSSGDTSNLPPTPPNFVRIVELNETGEFPGGDPTELEAGANRCAVV
jgi:hypothetical protein